MKPRHLFAAFGASLLAAALLPLAAQTKKVSWKQDILPLLNQNCTGADCHGQGFKAEGLDLETEPYEALVKVKSQQVPKLLLVKAKSPKESYAWHKLAGTHKSDVVKGQGETMPLSRGPLEKKELELIKAWIEQGAEKN